MIRNKWRRGKTPSAIRRCEQLETRVLLAGDLIAHWIADDWTDQVAEKDPLPPWTDRVNQIEATIVGTPKYLPASTGDRPAIQFDVSDGLDAFEVATADNPLNGAGDFTVAVVFRTDSLNFGTGQKWFEQTGLIDANQLGASNDWGVAINPEGKITAGVGAGFFSLPTNVSTDQTNLNDNQLHAVFFSRAGGEIAVSIDDFPANHQGGASVVPRDNGRTKMVIAGLHTSHDLGGFTGEIPEVRIYDGSLSSSEIHALNDEIVQYYNNRPPDAQPDIYTTDEEQFLTVTLQQSVLSNDSDADGDPLTAVLVENVSDGTLAFRDNGTFFYIPNTNFFGKDRFVYAAKDFRLSEPVEVTIDVHPTYDPAVPTPDIYKTQPLELLVVDDVQGVLANDLNVDESELRAELVTAPSTGSVNLKEDGSFIYDPEGFAGVATFEYVARDAIGTSQRATVSIIVNTPATSIEDTFEALEDQALELNAAQGVLANDRDADGNPMTAILVASTTEGILDLREDGSFRYQPRSDYFGLDQFTYLVHDGVDPSTETTVNLIVQPVDDVPVVSNDVYFGAPGEQIVTPLTRGVLKNDIDVDSVNLTTELVIAPAHGQLQLNQDGQFTYTPNDGFTGIDQFQYLTSDGVNQSGNANVFLFVGESPLIISEMLAANIDSVSTRTRMTVEDTFRGEETFPDWIEIQNRSSVPLDIGDYYLSNNERFPQQWQFPKNTVIPAQGFFTLFASDVEITDPQLDERGWLHTDFKLGLEPEYLALLDADGRILDLFGDEYAEQVPGVSFGISSTGEKGYLTTPTPGADNTAAYLGLTPDTQFDVDRGFYQAPFRVEITTNDPNFEIRYTFDGTPPTANNGYVYDGPILIDGTTTLRAATVREGYLTSDVDTQSYIFLDQVARQPALPQTGPSWAHNSYPEIWESTIQRRKYRADYEMDPEVIDDPQYANRLKESLTALPTLSVTLPAEDIFGGAGLYSNTNLSTEKGGSAEFFFPDGRIGFQIGVGLRMQGGASRNAEHTKHSMSLRFREDYGSGQLDYPLFEGSPVSQFDSIHLRARYNNSWIHWDQAQRDRGSMIREMWMRQTMLAAGQPAAGHGRYVHLYLNGLYWGVYEMHERQDANHYAAYFGGEPHQYAATNGLTAVDGHITRPLTPVSKIVDSGDWERTQEVLDIDNHIRFNIVHQYGGNQDFKPDGNWRAAGGGTANAPWQFYMWDSERVLESTRVRPTQMTDILGMLRDLNKNEEYRIRYADTIHEILFNDGPLTAENASQRWLDIAAGLDVPLIAESARWGDSKQNRPQTVNDQWIKEQTRLLESYFPVRVESMMPNYRDPSLRYLPWYPQTDAPEFLVDGERQHGGFKSGSLTVLNPGQVGTVYYTLDGSDPRRVGGEINPDAFVYSGEPIDLNQTTQVRMRILNGEEWSAITDATFFTELAANASNLRITEIQYHPHEPRSKAGELNVPDRAFEFLELSNISAETINLAGVELIPADVRGTSEGVQYSFAEHRLAPGESVVVVSDREAFESRYGSPTHITYPPRDDDLAPVGQWMGGNLANGGEQLTLVARDGSLIQQFRYGDRGGWPRRADGVGSSLELANLTDSSNSAENWQASVKFGGSPGIPSLPHVGVVINEVLSNSDAISGDQIELHNTTSTTLDISSWYISDSAAKLTKYKIPNGTTIPAGGYWVVAEGQLGFGLKGQGTDEVYITVGDENRGVTKFADDVRFDAAESDRTLGRWPNATGQLFPQVENSLGSINTGPVVPSVFISEIYYTPVQSPTGETLDEFIELWNSANADIMISGWHLDGGIRFEFPSDTQIASGGSLVVVPFDPTADPTSLTRFVDQYNLTDSKIIVGPYRGRLDDGGEELELHRSLAGDEELFSLVDRVSNDDESPWPIPADGQGAAIVRTGPTAFGDLSSSWTSQPPSPGSRATDDAFDLTGDGTIDAADIDQLCRNTSVEGASGDFNGDGTIDLADVDFLVSQVLGSQPGDANLDGLFNSTDLEHVMIAGEYSDGIVRNSGWSEGDWNCDQDFDSYDIVWAFNIGNYTAAAPAIPSLKRAALDPALTRSSVQDTDRHLPSTLQDTDHTSLFGKKDTDSAKRILLDHQVTDRIFAESAEIPALSKDLNDRPVSHGSRLVIDLVKT